MGKLKLNPKIEVARFYSQANIAFSEKLNCKLSNDEFWIIDIIGILQNIHKLSNEDWQIWEIKKQTITTNVLTAKNRNGHNLIKLNVENAIFSMEFLTIWCIEKTLILPEEY